MKKALIAIVIILIIGGGFYLIANNNKQLPKQSITAASPSPTQTAMPQSTGTHQFPYQPGSPSRGGFNNMPQGSTPIFGQVSTISDNQLTIQRQSRNGGNPTTIIVNLTSTTQYTGGSQTDIQAGTRIGGYGTKNSDGSIDAEQIMINPTFPGRGQNTGQNNTPTPGQ